MYHIGDRVAHPMHGAGTICAIQEQRCGGERRSYYVLCLLCGGLRLMIPCDAWEKAGLRPVLSREAAGELVRRFALLDPGEQPHWNQRYRENMLRIRSGDPAEVALVVRSLARRDQSRQLSTGERRLLASARDILASELALALDCGLAEARQLLAPLERE